MNQNREVYLIFKTHLDIGYTDLSEKVIQKYLKEYIPTAIHTGYTLKGSETPFVWSVGSWLIDRALRSEGAEAVEQAIHDGILRWHALPFTSHTELMNEKLFRYGLSLSRQLDERFSVHTIGAKMTDVPGHCGAIVPWLQEAGIKMVHFGVNPACPVPPVPKAFRWRRNGGEVIVVYSSGYGKQIDFDDFSVVYAHTGDNLGPQTPEQVVEAYEEAARLYPGAKIRVATLEDFAQRMLLEKNLPVVEKEIGDTWIYGAATDPRKISEYRQVLRYIDEHGLNADVRDDLLLVPEHTWGKCVQKYFHDTENYTVEQLAALPESAKTIEESWEEQREYVRKGAEKVGCPLSYPNAYPNTDGYEECRQELPLSLSWQIFDNRDADRYLDTYNIKRDEPWIVWDYSKPGLPDYQGGTLEAAVDRCCQNNGAVYWELSFDPENERRFGLPKFCVCREKNRFTVYWKGKKDSRYPQACYLKFTGMKEEWMLDKMGQWVDPREVIGSPLVCAVASGVKNDAVRIYSDDAPVVLPFGRRLWHYGEENGKQDLYFNLYNNIWNTNFAIWYHEDAVFRFSLEALS